MIYFEEYLEIDESKKDIVWANTLITHFRTYWKPLVSEAKAEDGMNLVLSRYNMDHVMKMFKDPSKMGFEFLPIAIMEKIRNILIGERVKAGINVNMNALDPASDEDKNGDRKLLQSRSEMEALFTYLQSKIGLPEYKLSQEKNLGKKNPFRGNVEQFDELGLDDTSEYQIGYFFQVWHRLMHEMDAQFLVNYFFEINQVKDFLDLWVNDVMAKKAIAMEAYVNEFTGKIDLNYLKPERTKCIPGKRNDGKDAICLGYEDTCTVGEFLRKVGNEFNMEADMQFLLMAVNYYNHTDYSGIWSGVGSDILYGTDKSTLCNVGDFMNFQVNIGTIQWKSWTADAYKVGVDYHGNLRYYKSSLNDPEDPTHNDSGYAREKWYNEFTYKAFFLATTSASQKLYKFGKLYHQAIEGAEDEYSNYSIFFKKEAGPTIAEVSRPWIEIAQESFTKFRWMIRKAKPKGRAYNYESLVKIGQRMINSGNTKQNILGVIKMWEEGINEIFTIPEVGGERIGGGVNPNYDLPNGLDPTAITFRDIIQWCVANIKEDLAITQLREAYNPKPNDGLQLQLEAKQSSENATNYIGEMLDNLFRSAAKTTLLYCQDIVKYQDTIPYNFLKQVIGDDGIDRLEQLGNIAHHRYGIFINSFNTYMQRQKIMQDTEAAWQNKEIDYATKILVDSIDDFRKAAYILAFEKARADKEKQKELAQQHANMMQLESQKNANKMAEIDREGKWRNKTENTRGWWYYMAINANNKNKEQIKQMGIDSEGEKQGIRTDNKIREMGIKNQLEQGAALPSRNALPPPQQGE
jgi:hypothetical protein